MIDEEVTHSDLSERVHYLKIPIKIKPGCDERDVWPLRNRILDMHRTGMTGWPENLKVQVEVNPRKKPYVTEMGKLLRWLRKMDVTECVKVEWRQPCKNRQHWRCRCDIQNLYMVAD